VILGDQRADFVTGMANAELGLPMTAETVVQIGSTTKVLNAALIMSLVDDGTLDLDRPVKAYIPNLDLEDDDAERTITLRQLLSMTSGLDNGPYTRHGGRVGPLRGVARQAPSGVSAGRRLGLLERRHLDRRPRGRAGDR
jgi:CubicO group peptidase (beta-lactamase class C family)